MLFRIASWPYGLVMRFRNLLYDTRWKRTFRAAVPVVSIGNLTLGGTGKTPCVEYVARYLRDSGVRPVILSRGYGAEQSRNDEAMVLEENLPDVPHLQGADRVALAMTAVEELDAEVLVLDDGFQHRRLQRDLEIVLLDATAPLAREAIFPRGLLREPISGLRRADLLILTRCDLASDPAEQVAWLNRRFPGQPVAMAIHAPEALIGASEHDEPVETLANSPVAAFCGIGNPEAFRSTLAAVGATPIAFRTFPDHHAYTRKDVEDLHRWAHELPDHVRIVTTQKDWVKLRLAELGGRPLLALRIGFKFITGETDVHNLLNRVIPESHSDDLQPDEDDA